MSPPAPLVPMTHTSPMPPLSATSSLAQAVADLGAGASPGAWALIAEQCSRRMGLLALRLTGRGDLADDVVQEALLLIRAHARSFSPRSADADGDAMAWILRVTTTTALQLLRAQRRLALREAYAGPRDGSSTPRPEQHLEDQEQAAQVRAALLGLPLRLQTVLALHVIEGFSHAAIAQALQLPLGSAKTYLRRAQDRMRAALGPSVDRLLLAVFAAAPAGAPGPLPSVDGRAFQQLLTSPRQPRWAYAGARRLAAGYRLAAILVSACAGVAVLVAAAVILCAVAQRRAAAPSASPRAAAAWAGVTPSLHAAPPPALPRPMPVPVTMSLSMPQPPVAGYARGRWALTGGIRFVTLVVRAQPLGDIIDLLNDRYDAHIRIDPANPGRRRLVDLESTSMPLDMVCANLSASSGLAIRPDGDGFTVAMPSDQAAAPADTLIQKVTVIPAPDRGQGSAASDAAIHFGGGYSTAIGRCGWCVSRVIKDDTDIRLLYGLVIRQDAGLSAGMGHAHDEDSVLHSTQGIGGQTLDVVADDRGQRASIMGKELDLSRGHVLLISLAGGEVTVQQIDVDFGSAPIPVQPRTFAETAAFVKANPMGNPISARFVAWIMSDPRAQRLIQ